LLFETKFIASRIADSLHVLVANGHNAIGRFTKPLQQRGRHAGSHHQSGITRDWFRPIRHSESEWSLRNNVNMQESAILLAMNFCFE